MVAAAETSANGLATLQKNIFDVRPAADMSMNRSWHSLLASLVFLLDFFATLPTPLVRQDPVLASLADMLFDSVVCG